MTPDGYPVPLCGKPLTKTPIVVRNEGASLKTYPEYFVPEQEGLAPNEMRLTAVGSGNPPVRRGQASTSWLVELGNGDKFLIDAGGGTVPALWSLRIPLAQLDKLFLTHRLRASYLSPVKFRQPIPALPRNIAYAPSLSAPLPCSRVDIVAAD